MPEYLFEPSQSMDGNTVSFNSYCESDGTLNELGIPQEFAGIFDSAVPSFKPANPIPIPQYYIPMRPAQFGLGHNYFVSGEEQENYELLAQSLESNLNNVEMNYNFENSLRYMNLQHEYLRQDMSFNPVPELESVFSDSAINTPNILSVPILMNQSFESGAQPFFMAAGEDSDMNFNRSRTPLPAKKSNDSGSSKKHKRKHIMARSRTGCWICRIKHLKCDEIRPTCNNCTRFGICCDYSEARPAYVLNSFLRREKLNSITTKKRRRISD